MASYYKDRTTWTVAYDGRLDGLPRGKRAYIYGLTRKLAEQAAAAKSTQEGMLRAGLLHVDAGAAKLRSAEALPISEHIEAFRQSILDKGREPRHASQQAGHLKRVCELAGITRLSEIDAGRVQAACKRLMDELHLSPRTANAAVKAWRQFATWCSTSTRTAFDVLHRKLTVYNEEDDKRRRRRALTQEELDYLVAWLVMGGRDKYRRCGVNRLDRAMLYQVAVGTGYRLSALLSLTKASFHVAANLTRPAIVLAAVHNKKGRDREQPIRRDLADCLRKWLEEKPDTGRVFAVTRGVVFCDRFRRDLDGARAAWVAEATTTAERKRREESTFLQFVYDDGRGRVWADFHALRHTGITLVVRRAGLKAGQHWADHSTPLLTSRYAHMDLTDEAAALDALPPAMDGKRTKKDNRRTG